MDGNKLTVELAGKGRRRGGDRGERGSGRGGPQSEDECWHCGERGHW